MLHLKVNIGYEIVTINPFTLDIEEGNDDIERYHKSTDKKWINFCKEHGFHPIKDANNKIYDLYLQLCIEGLV